ncbi:hypothetical protein [Ralstonia sp. Ralssp110]|uniref:hypothetical protein n=1 Tax=Ralstonia sp. Ralssp110 TaxID=3243004 RepID=UPI0039B64E5F
MLPHSGHGALTPVGNNTPFCFRKLYTLLPPSGVSTVVCPPAEKVGKAYYVDEHAVFSKDARRRLVHRIAA